MRCLLSASSLQRAVKIEKRTDVRTVRQEYKVLRRLQAGCRQAVRVHEGGEYAGGGCRGAAPRAVASPRPRSPAAQPAGAFQKGLLLLTGRSAS